MNSGCHRLYYSIREGAKLLELSTTKVYRLISSGYLPATRVGPRLLRIREADLKQFIAERDEFFSNYYSYKEASTRLRVTPQTIENWVRARYLDAHKFATFPTGVLKEHVHAIDAAAARQIPEAV